MPLKPLGSNLLVESKSVENVTASGIIIAGGEKAEQDRGTVIAVGLNVTEDIQVGDTVIFKKWGKEDIEIVEGGTKKKYLIVAEEDVMAILVE